MYQHHFLPPVPETEYARLSSSISDLFANMQVASQIPRRLVLLPTSLNLNNDSFEAFGSVRLVKA